MSELLIRIKDHWTPNEPHLYHRMHKAGDVIWVAEDGWPWGQAELGNGITGDPNGNYNFFRVLKLPNIPKNDLVRLMCPEFQVDTQRDNPFLQARSFFLDRGKVTTPPLAPALVAAAPAAMRQPVDRRTAISGVLGVGALIAATATALLPDAQKLADYWDDDSRKDQFIVLDKWNVTHLNSITSKRTMVEH